MGQGEIYLFLYEKRKHSEKWFSSKEIIEAISKEKKEPLCKSRVYQCLLKLTIFNFLECRGMGIKKHYKEFRVKLDNN